MYSYRITKPLMLVAVGVWLPALGLSRVDAQPRPQPDRVAESQSVEVLGRGPIHEAFAEPIVFNATPGIVVPKRPPDSVVEMPPDQKPVGDHVLWIPGYWSWDQEREDFLWVSGFWRAVPPAREWIPGYWYEVSEGWQWVSGFWADARVGQTEYLPQPPESLEYGPTTPAPGDNYFWTPGYWNWYQNQYVWRPGFWVVARQNWNWVPPYYAWSPLGYVFINGYWDYPIVQRGLLFAPVYFNSPIYAQSNYFFSPMLAVNLALLTNHFFVAPRQNQYFFGDYYAANYANQGLYPWYSFASGRTGYDPIYAYARSQNARSDPNWENRVREDFQFRREHQEARPQQTVSVVGTAPAQDKNLSDVAKPLVQPIAQVAAATSAPVKLEKVSSDRRKELSQQGQETHEFTKQRVQLETSSDQKSALTTPTRPGQPKKDVTQLELPGATKSQPAKNQPAVKLDRPKSPIISPSLPAPEKNRTTPSTPVTPNVPSKVEPKTPTTPSVPTPNLKVEPKPPATPPSVPKPVPKVEPKPPKVPSIPTPVPKTEPKPLGMPPSVPTPSPKVQPKLPAAPPTVPTPAPKAPPQPPAAPPSVPTVPKVQPPQPPATPPSAPNPVSPPHKEKK